MALDDEPLALEVIKKYIAADDRLRLAAVFDNAEDAAAYITNNTVDVLFTDIDMPGINGIEFINSLPVKPVIIFTTAHTKYALDAFETDVTDYLLKPFDISRFNKAVEKALRFVTQAEKNNCCYVYEEYKLVKINFSEVLYAESMQDYIKIHLQNNKAVMTLMTLKRFVELLPSESFLQVHRSYVVATNKINTLTQKEITITNGTQIPVGNSFTEALKTLKNKLIK